jgi:hypothetical protein
MMASPYNNELLGKNAFFFSYKPERHFKFAFI